MADEQKTKLRLEIAHVLFIDIVGYSKLLIDEQTDALQELNQIVRNTQAVHQAESVDQLIRLPAGDGMALVFTSSAEAPVECALQIAKALRGRSDLKVRMGIHSGPVHHVSDVNERTNITGAGINIAQRVMDCGDADHILLSKHVADDLEQYRHWRPLLYDLGECEVKHGQKVSIVNLHTDEAGNPLVPAKFTGAASATTARRKSTLPSRVLTSAAIFILAAIGFGSFLFLKREKTSTSAVRSTKEQKSIVVLPFENATRNTETEYLSDGMSEALINSLSELPQLRVIARSTAFRYKGKQVDPQAVGRDLKVQTVLMGVVRQLGDRLNVQVDLVDAVTGAQLWGHEYERKLADVLAVKQSLVLEVTEKLRVKPTGEQQQRLTQRDTTEPEAYQFYLKGRYYWNKRTAENVKKAVEQFQQAADKDPNYALAYVGLADCWLLQEDYVGVPALESYPKAKAFAQRALKLDNTLAEAHTSLGYVYTSLWEWERAQAEFNRSIELNPNYAVAPHWYSICLLSLGKFDEAMALIKRATELDPVSPVIGTTLTYAYFATGDVNASIAQCKRVVELDPNYPRAHEYLGLGYLKQARYSEALAELQKAVDLSGRDRRPLRDLGYGYAISGKRAEALAILDEVKWNYEKRQALGQDLAAVYAGLGEIDQAFAWLEKDYQARSGLLPWIRWVAPFDSLRRDPRCADLLQRMGLQP